jgi:hypothetical protein
MFQAICKALTIEHYPTPFCTMIGIKWFALIARLQVAKQNLVSSIAVDAPLLA